MSWLTPSNESPNSSEADPSTIGELMTDPTTGRHSEPKPPRPHRIRWTRSDWVAWIAFGVAALAIVAAAVTFLWGQHAYQEKDQAQARANAGIGAATSANASLSAAGLPTVEIPSSVAAPTATVTVTGPQGDTGAQGPGPSSDQVSDAVASYCRVNNCATGPTAAQVAQAVATYCDANGQCKGPTGPPGAAGTNGADGQNATAQQVADGVNSYCGEHNGCAGAQGAQGGNGADGQPPVSWTYSDLLGGSHTCNRTSPFDPNAPTYSCS